MLQRVRDSYGLCIALFGLAGVVAVYIGLSIIATEAFREQWERFHRLHSYGHLALLAFKAAGALLGLIGLGIAALSKR